MKHRCNSSKRIICKNNRIVHLLLALVVAALFFVSKHASAASTLNVDPQYNKTSYKKELEVVLQIESSSEVSSVKYLDSHILNPGYFTKYPDECTEIKKNKSGKYSFTAKENGTYTAYVANTAGEEALCVVTIRNIDNEAPDLSVTWESLSSFCSVSLQATDNVRGKVSVKYAKGTHTNENGSVWKNASSFYNEEELLLVPGTYSFLLTDNAGNTKIVVETIGEVPEKEKDKEFRAVWIAYLAFKTSGYTEQEFTAHIETMFDDVVAMNMNAVVVHVRPFGDAMYDSEYFPWSKYVSGTQGKDPGFDPLEIMVREAHERGLEFHAWLNPYRITSSSTNVLDLAADNPARVYLTDQYKANDRNVLTYDGKLYYNPASTQVQNLIVNGIKEIVENYDVYRLHHSF